MLWYPRGWMRWGAFASQRRAKRRRPRASAEDHKERLPGDESLWLGEEFNKRRNWIDLLRGLAGGYAVAVVGIQVRAQGGETGGATEVLLLIGGVLLMGVAAQTLRFEGRLAFYPPVFFLGGLSFALVGAKAAFFAFVAVWAVNLALPSASVFLFCYSGFVLILGVLFGAPIKHAGLAAALALAPVVASLLMRRRLMAQFGRKAKIVSR